ncbi:uncharacterized protein [Lolium perenne]|uniref:uncharacterized protein n=1 Tax=Lolium perenne TaxID=4522 RepID=UPI0021EB3666|nr:uncharacterized protein LOC127341255 [Lolium perenne]
MASPPPTWSVTACLRYRGGLEIRAAAENVLPGWGHGGERLSFLLRVRRSLHLTVTSQCGRDPEPDKKPRGLKLLRFLRSSFARAPRVPSLLRRRKTPPQPRAAAVAKPGSRAPAILSVLDRALMWPATATTTTLCFLAALAVAAALRIMVGFMIPSASCGSWRCFLAKKFVRVLGPPLFEWLSRISLKLIKFLDPRWSWA